MTAYAASLFVTSATGNLSVAVTAGSYAIRVPQAQLVGTYGGNSSPGLSALVSTYSGGASGGSATTIASMRAGSPAATASAKTNASGSGTQYLLGINNTSVALGGSTFAQTTTSLTFQPPFDVIIAPGQAVVASLVPNGVTNCYGAGIVVFFEELRLSWHY